MTGIRIRAARLGEGHLLPQIERSAGRLFGQLEDLAWLADADDLPSAFHERLIADRTCWLAAYSPAAVVGFLSAEAIDRSLHLWELSVAAPWQRRGIGTRLVEHAIREAIGRRMDDITLTTFRAVPWNAPFYAGLGFQPVALCDDRLDGLLRKEEASGLNSKARCAMRLVLAHEPRFTEPPAL